MKKIKLSYLITCVILLTTFICYSIGVGVAWDHPTDSRVVGYKVHYGTNSRGPYQYIIDVKYTNYVRIDTNWVMFKTNYIVATSYDAYGNQSDYSKELSWVPAWSLIAVSNLTIKKVGN